jgi:hypothetical protein
MQIRPPLALTRADAVRMGCTIWLAMFGNGWRIRMMPRIIRHPRYQIHWDLIRVTIACYGVVRGAIPSIPRVPRLGIRIFITTTPTMSTADLAFAVPGMRLHKPCPRPTNAPSKSFLRLCSGHRLCHYPLQGTPILSPCGTQALTPCASNKLLLIDCGATQDFDL